MVGAVDPDGQQQEQRVDGPQSSQGRLHPQKPTRESGEGASKVHPRRRRDLWVPMQQIPTAILEALGHMVLLILDMVLGSVGDHKEHQTLRCSKEHQTLRGC